MIGPLRQIDFLILNLSTINFGFHCVHMDGPARGPQCLSPVTPPGPCSSHRDSLRAGLSSASGSKSNRR